MRLITLYRKKLAHFRSDERQRHIPALVGLSIAILCLILTSLLANVVRNSNSRDLNAQMYNQTSNIVRYKKDRINAYHQLLVYAATLDQTNGGITEKMWQDFYTNMSVLQRYSSIVGIGHVVYLPKDELPMYQQTYLADTGRNLVVHPQTTNNAYYVIAHLTPMNAENAPVIGFDMGSESIRSTAMRKAAITNNIILTKPINLVQNEVTGTSMPGLLMYQPLYNVKPVPPSPSERLAALKGFVYVVYRPHDILKNAVSNAAAKDVMQLTLQDVTDDKPATLYRYTADNYSTKNTASMSQLFDAENRTWRISLTMRNSSLSQQYGPFLILTTGLVISLTLGLLLYAILLHRFHKLETAHKALLQESKDALLAVASHQLRTPASAVKQYVGMLKQGFAGDLSPEQSQMIDKAYAANERQLEIINQLLYVAKADAGQLFIDRQQAELYPIIENSIAELHDRAETKNIRVSFKGKKTIKAFVDPHFMSMAIENLVSNAIKYSYPDTTVNVSLISTPSRIEITVRDQGVGVSEEDFEAMFEKFNRIENPLSRAEGGSGIGLFLTKRLIEAHGGDIEVKSQKDKGSTFTIYLPHLTGESKDEFSLG